MKLLEKIQNDYYLLKELSIAELNQLCEEIRKLIIETVSKNGGHLSSNLGNVELVVAIHRVFNIPPDKIIWDVGHQCYTHKILTGRFRTFNTLRKFEGISGFPNPQENINDIFFVGHAGTAISSSLGLKIGEEFGKKESKIIAFIGDGSLTNGLTFEGLNFLGKISKEIKIILNDNKMSISSTQGALSYYLTKFVTSPVVSKPKEEFLKILKKIPGLGEDVMKIAKEVEKKAKFLLIPGVFFEKLGIKYFGPINGHNLEELIEILQNIKEIKEPIVLHVITKKGKGYKFAEEDPERFHSVNRFDIETGKIEDIPSNSKIVGEILTDLGEKYDFFVITPAMEKGLGLEKFAKKFPERFFDVGIAESHAVTFASGIAKTGFKVFVAIYSTFLQRAYDQILHDICLQKLPVVFLIDRAGIVGGDGPTHQGIFDISFLKPFPGIKIYAPCSIKTLKEIIENSINESLPIFIRYPRELLPEIVQERIIENSDIVILGVGSIAFTCFKVMEMLNKENIRVSFIPVEKIKPIEEEFVEKLKNFEKIIIVEENILTGGFGSLLLEITVGKGYKKDFLRIGIPETFVEHGEREKILEKLGLDEKGIFCKIKEFLNDRKNLHSGK